MPTVGHQIKSKKEILKLENKVVIVTGGSRGIGAAISKLAGQKGWSVCVNYNNSKSSADEVVNEISKSGGTAFAVAGDISNESDVVRLFEVAESELGQLTALVNNAGIITPQSPLVEMDVSRLQQVFNTNVIGSFLCAREAVKRMSSIRNGGGGSITNLSSAAARIGSPNEFIDYAASKGAIDTMTLGLAKEVAIEGIRVNAVRPGIIDTNLHADAGDATRPEKLKQYIPMQRVGSPEEVARTVLWLMSQEASYITGALVDVTGGR